MGKKWKRLLVAKRLEAETKEEQVAPAPEPPVAKVAPAPAPVEPEKEKKVIKKPSVRKRVKKTILPSTKE